MTKTKRKVSSETEEKKKTKKMKKEEEKKEEETEENEIEEEEEEEDTEVVKGLRELLYTIKQLDMKPYTLLFNDDQMQGTFIAYATHSSDVPLQASRFCSIDDDNKNLCSALIDKNFILSDPSLISASFYKFQLGYRLKVRDEFSSCEYHELDAPQRGIICLPKGWDEDEAQAAYFRGLEHEIRSLLESKGKQLLSITEIYFTVTLFENDHS